MIPELYAHSLETNEAATAMSSAGVMIVHDLYDEPLLKEFRLAFEERYGSFVTEEEQPGVLKVGHKRSMVTVALEEPFNTPELTDNIRLRPVMERCLGPDYLLNSYGVVAALPGSEAQHLHRDHPGLFGRPLDDMLPNYAITLIVPLVESANVVGPTIVWPGSHRQSKDDALAVDGIPAIAPLGSALLMDYRLLHGGGPNLSAEVRPIVYSVFSRPWFVDVVNFREQPRLL